MSNNFQVIEVCHNSKVTDLQTPFTEEQLRIRTARDLRIKYARQESKEALMRDIKILQDASRVQFLSKEAVAILLVELRTKKDLLSLDTGEL